MESASIQRSKKPKLPLMGIKSMNASRMHKWQIAHFLISGGVRPINVESVTRLSRHQLNSLWVAIHGFPAKGQTPVFSCIYFRSHHAIREGIALVKILSMYGDQDINDPAVFLAAYQRFREVMPWNAELSMEKAFYLWRDYRKKIIVLRHCTRCKASYLYTEQADASNTMRNCTFCKVYNHTDATHKKILKEH